MALRDDTDNFSAALGQPARSSVRDYLRKRGLKTETIGRFRLGYSADFDGITIPFVSARDIVVMLKVRRLGNAKPKYLTMGHSFPLPVNTHLFNVSALREPGTLVLCEGEFDAMILAQEGIPAVGIPGVESWQDHWGLLLPRQVVLLMDPDDQGLRAAHSIRKSVSEYGTSARIGTLTEGDITEEYVRGGGIEAIQEAIASAQ